MVELSGTVFWYLKPFHLIRQLTLQIEFRLQLIHPTDILEYVFDKRLGGTVFDDPCMISGRPEVCRKIW